MSARLKDGHFPVLQHQVRTSTGCTHAPYGALRLPAGWGSSFRTETPVQRDISVKPKPRAKRSKIKGDL